MFLISVKITSIHISGQYTLDHDNPLKTRVFPGYRNARVVIIDICTKQTQSVVLNGQLFYLVKI